MAHWKPTSLVGAIGLLTLGFLVTACAPAVVEEPTVSWEDGEPSGEWESDPWVEAVRASDTALSIATVTRDYTSEDLARTTTPAAIDAAASVQRDEAEAGRFFTYPGPVPMLPIEVEDQGDNALVTVCQARDWYLDGEQTELPALGEGRTVVYRVTRVDDRHLVETESVSTESCDLSGAAVGLFDPQPDPSETYSPDDVKEPS
jgi:hypothetical protein